MPGSILADLAQRLDALQSGGLHRSLRLPSGIDWSSNDYLGLSTDPRLRRRLLERLTAQPDLALGAPGSRLLRGNTGCHQALEDRLAAWKGSEAALLLASGWQANVGLLGALLGPHDRVISDAQNHASLIDGLRLAGCTRTIVPHLDLDAVAGALARRHAGGHTFVVTESLFSMDGDVADLTRLAALADQHGAGLIIDDAHATGLYGPRGAGLATSLEPPPLAIVSTFGKAFGLAGAFVAGPRVVIDNLLNRGRAFLFSTAVPPLLVTAIDVALDLVIAADRERLLLVALADRLRQRLRAGGLDCLASCGPIVPVVLGDNQEAMAVAARVQARGFDVRAVRPPTVAPGTARLRISVHANHSLAEVDALAAAVVAAVSSRSSRASELPAPPTAELIGNAPQ
jgi:8-amino-7-oxononanoate synthase